MNTKVTKKPVINPFETLDQNKNTVEIPATSSGLFKEIPKVGNNATKIDFEKLNQSYANQDAGTIKELQNNLTSEYPNIPFKLQFFRKYRKEEEEYYLKRKKEEEEKKKQEELLEQEKKRREEARLAQQGGEIPHGKKRKNIFVKIREKATTLLPPELKPGGGKQ